MNSIRQEMIEGLWKTWVTPALCVAARLKLADLLSGGALSVSELSNKTNTNEKALYRLLRALAGEGVFKEEKDKHFSLTPKAQCLRSDSEDSIRNMVLWFGSDWHWDVWNELFYSVETGKPAFDYCYKSPLFEFLVENPSAAEVFDKAMVDFSAHVSDQITKAYDFSKFGIIADIGGGYGGLLSSILKATPNTKGVLFDLLHVVTKAKTLLSDNMKERVSFASGDFFHTPLPKADAYLFKSIIHDWDDERCIQILKNCRSVISTDGKLLVLERVVPHGNEPSISKLTDLEMLVLTTGGKERTEEEYKDLFSKSGFQLTQVVETGIDRNILEGTPV